MQQDQHSARDGGGNPILFGIGAAVTLVILFNAGVLVLQLLTGEPEGGLKGRAWIFGVAQFALMFLPTLLLARTQPGSLGNVLRFRRAPISTYFAVIVGIISLGPILNAWLLVQEIYLVPLLPPDIQTLVVKLEQEANRMYSELLGLGGGAGLIVAMLIGAVIPALSEETLFRGLVQGSFERRLRPGWAILLAALIFGLLHVQITFIALVAIGAYLGYVTWTSGSIWPAVLGHAIFNAVTIVALNRADMAAEIGRRHTPEDLFDLLPIAGMGVLIFVGDVFWLRVTRAKHPASAAPVVPSSLHSIDNDN